MTAIFSTGAVLRLLSARRDDPLVAWVERTEVRPFISATTMALVRQAILASDAISPGDRGLFLKRYEHMDHGLRTGRSRQVTLALLDMKGAEILSDLLAIDAGREALSDLELVPAAIAVQHNLDLIVMGEVDAWRDLAAAVQPETGRLKIRHPGEDPA
jgi:hypothetical protein